MKYRTETEDYEERLSTIRREHSSLKRLHEDLEGSLSATRQALHQLTADTSALQCRYDTVKVCMDKSVRNTLKINVNTFEPSNNKCLD